MTRPLRRATTAALLACALLAVAAAPSRAGEAPAVLLYGDSLATESATYLADHLPRDGWDATLRVFPGASPCSWLEKMPDDAREVAPSLVVVALVGIDLAPCGERGTRVAQRCVERGGTFEECVAEQFEADVERDTRGIARFWAKRDVPVLWASLPPAPGSTEDEIQITSTYRDVAKRRGQHFVDAADALRDADGTWAMTLPCLRGERAVDGCADGRIQVRRSVENGHLCPIEPVPAIAPCPVYSSGVARWAGAIAAASHRLMSTGS